MTKERTSRTKQESRGSHCPVRTTHRPGFRARFGVRDELPAGRTYSAGQGSAHSGEPELLDHITTDKYDDTPTLNHELPDRPCYADSALSERENVSLICKFTRLGDRPRAGRTSWESLPCT